MKKALPFFLLLAVLAGHMSFAQSFSVVSDGDTIYYVVSSNKPPYTVTVIGKPYDPDGLSFAPDSYQGDIVIPETVDYGGKSYIVTAIHNNAFANCRDLTSLVIPNTIRSMSLNRNPALTGYTDRMTYNEYGNAYYVGNEENPYVALVSVRTDSSFGTFNINPSTKLISSRAVYGRELTSISVPDGVEAINELAFYNCRQLKTVALPDGLTHIGKQAFGLCDSLTTCLIPSSVVYIGMNAFPTSLPRNTYQDVVYLAGVGNPYYAAVKMSGAFTVKSATFHPNTRVLAENLFGSYNRIDTLHMEGNQPPYISNALYASGTKLFSKVEVPCGAMSNYRASDGWKEQTNLRSSCEFAIQVNVDDASLASGTTHYYEEGESAELRIKYLNNIPVYVESWDDGVEGFPRYVTVSGNATYTAHVKNLLATTNLDVNNVVAGITPMGTVGYDGSNTHYSVPAGGSTSTVYASSLWISGKKGFETPQAFAPRFSDIDGAPGPLRVESATPADVLTPQFARTWTVTRQDIDNHISGLDQPGYQAPENILSWPAHSNVGAGYGSEMAPFYDADGNGNYNPYAGDYPLIMGDKAVYAIYNDVFHLGDKVDECTSPELGPLGVEVHAMFYAFNEPADLALNNTIFVNYRVYNRSATDVTDAYMGVWTDFDLGYAFDDFIGCDVTRGSYYAYNGKEVDGPGTGSFSENIPIQVCTFLAGPTLPVDGVDNPSYNGQSNTFVNNAAINGFGYNDGVADNERMGMTGFVYYNNSAGSVDGEPTTAADYHNYLSGHWKNGQPIMYGGNGVNSGITNLPCRFMFPGDSDPLHWGTNFVTPSENPDSWTEVSAYNAPGDRRGLGSSGPFTFAAGSMQQMDAAHITAWNPGGNASVDDMRRSVDSVRNAFNRQRTNSGKDFVYKPYSAPRDVNVEMPVAAVNVSLYPNPTNGNLTVKSSDCILSVEVMDMRGVSVYGSSPNNDCTNVNLEKLSKGVYIVRVVTDNGVAVSRVIRK